MADVKIPFEQYSETQRTKYDYQISEYMGRILNGLIEYRHDVIHPLVLSLQRSMCLHETFYDALVVQDVKEASKHIRRNDISENIVEALFHAETKRRQRNDCLSLGTTLYTHGYELQEGVAKRLVQKQSLDIRRHGYEIEVITGWLKKYQEALNIIIHVFQDTEMIPYVVHNMMKHHMTEDFLTECLYSEKACFTVKLQHGKEVENPFVSTRHLDGLISKLTQTLGNCLSRKMNELICVQLNELVVHKLPLFCMEKRYCREFYDSQVFHGLFKPTDLRGNLKLSAIRLFALFNAQKEKVSKILVLSTQRLHRYLNSALEEEIKVVQKLRTLYSDIHHAHHRIMRTPEHIGQHMRYKKTVPTDSEKTADDAKKPFKLMVKAAETTCHFSQQVERILNRLHEYKHDVTYRTTSSLLESMNLRKEFHDVLLISEVEVVSVNEENKETILESIKEKRNGNINVMAYVGLEVEKRDHEVRVTNKNNHVFEDFPCGIIIDILEEGTVSSETIAWRLSKIDPLPMATERSENINAWLQKYQKALRIIIAICKDADLIRKVIHDIIKQHQSENFIMSSSDLGFQTRLKPNKQTIQTIAEDMSRWMVKTINDRLESLVRCKQVQFCMQDRYGREFYDSIARGLCQGQCEGKRYMDIEQIEEIFCQSTQRLHRYITSALEEEIKIVHELRIPIPERAKVISFCYGLTDSKQCSIGLRAESFHQIYVMIDPSIDATIDKKTVREATQETQNVDEYIQDNFLNLSPEQKRQLYKVINKYSEELMKNHSNLNSIGISPVLSRQRGIVEKPCIIMYCSCKGIIPRDEHELPMEIENFPVDVREGYCFLFSSARQYNDPLRLGISIGGQGINVTGTLGPFVVEIQNKTTTGFLTCKHVFHSAAIGSNVVQPSNEDSKSDSHAERVCGQIQSMCMEDVKFQERLTTVDVAYVVIKKRIPKDFKFPDIPKDLVQDFRGISSIGKPTIDLKQDDKRLDVYKFGRTTELTKGRFENMDVNVRFGRISYRNLYQIASNTVFAKHGDSGAGVFVIKDNNVSLIGILLGGSNDGKTCYVIPIGAALHAIQPPLEIQQFEDEATAGVEFPNADRQSDDENKTDSGACADPHLHLSRSIVRFSLNK